MNSVARDVEDPETKMSVWKLAMRNVFNTSYRSFLSRYKEFALDPGRNLIIRLSAGDVD